MMPISTPISLTVGPAEGVSVFSGQDVGLQRSSCCSAAAYAQGLSVLFFSQEDENFRKYEKTEPDNIAQPRPV